jgi:hypothetical protein
MKVDLVDKGNGAVFKVEFWVEITLIIFKKNWDLVEKVAPLLLQ